MDAVNQLPEVGEAVVFMLAGQRYALPIGAVQEIQQIVSMTDVPDSTPGVVGMVNLRGGVIPAVDMRRLLRMEPRAYDLQTPMIIARVGGGLVALLVDEVEDVVALPSSCLQVPDGIYELADRLLAVCRFEAELIFLLDPEKLVTRRASVAAPMVVPSVQHVSAEDADDDEAADEEAPAKPKAKRTRKKAE
jgi:purine-binding chemotaxis protein CheW